MRRPTAPACRERPPSGIGGATVGGGSWQLGTRTTCGRRRRDDLRLLRVRRRFARFARAPLFATALARAVVAVCAVGAPQRGPAHEPDHEREPLGELRDLVGVGVRQRVAQRSPDDFVQRIDRSRGLRRIARARQPARARRQQLERPTRLEPAQVVVVGERADDRVAQPRSLTREVPGEDRRHVIKRRVLEQRQQPALCEILNPPEQHVDRRVGDRPRAAPAWRTSLHEARISRLAVGTKATVGTQTARMGLVAEQLITVANAREIVLRNVEPLGIDRIPVGDALDRVLAADIVAADDAPPFPCSAMDGYAIRAGAAGRELTVVGESRAGKPSDHTLRDGQAVRISTGAAVPDGADAVIRQEDVEGGNGRITLTAATDAGENVRGPGEDMRAGITVLKAGTSLGVVELGVAVGAGAGEVAVAETTFGRDHLHGR